MDGSLVYTFGKAQTSSNTTIRWNGVGIKASVGTSVRSVADGKVVSVGQLGTYGLTVIIDHGGGDYSIYGSLNRARRQTAADGDEGPGHWRRRHLRSRPVRRICISRFGMAARMDVRRGRSGVVASRPALSSRGARITFVR